MTQPPTLRRTRPQVIAHRGSSRARPEHTPSAYVLAIDEGADAVECDVRLTADRHLVCVHDRRIDRTSTGEGVVSTLTLDELMALDFGAWHGESTPGVLTLDALLDLLEAAPRPVDLAVETKHPNRYRGGVENALAETLRRRGFDRPRRGYPTVRAMSFSALAMRRVGQLLPEVERVLLLEAAASPRVRAGRLPYGIPICGLGVSVLRRDPDIVARQHAAGHPVHVYTVDEPADVDRCLDLGVDGIITNRPRMIREAVAKVWEPR